MLKTPKSKLLSALKVLKSFKIFIFFIILLAGSVPCLILRYAILDTYVDRAVDLKTSDVSTQGLILANHLITYNYLYDQSNDVVNAELSQFAQVYDGRILVVDSNFRVIKDTYDISNGKYMISEEIISCFKGKNTSNYDVASEYLEMTIPLTQTVESSEGNEQNSPGGNTNVIGVLLLSVSTESYHTTRQMLNHTALVIVVSAIILLTALSFLIAFLVSRPFGRVTSAIRELKDGSAGGDIHVNTYYETEQISEAFNDVYGKMRRLDASRDEFVSNVSHELKTPMTSMKVLADSLLMQEDVPAELYKEFMTDIADEIDRENKIINDLLSLVKLDKSNADVMNIEKVDINAELELILKRLRPIAIKRGVELVLECVRPVVAEVDDMKLTLAFTNLIENAIKYNKEQGFVKVILDADHQKFTVHIADSGIGIPQESLDMIYERFYRVDKSHSREIGGTGLGLAITKNAIDMHYGTISAASEVGVGTTFTVEIPLGYVRRSRA